jgi:glucan biosynthesis protein C
MQTLFYLPFFILGAQVFINPRLKTMFTTRRHGASSARC